MEEMDFQAWLQFGVSKGWTGVPVCYTHDGLPTSEEEDREFEEGDPCIHIVRMYETVEEKLAVEKNHSASSWRASNTGIAL